MEGINTSCTAETTFILRFSPESYECCALAGLLACSAFDNLPVPTRIDREKQWFKKDQKLMELTASGNAPDFLPNVIARAPDSLLIPSLNNLEIGTNSPNKNTRHAV